MNDNEKTVPDAVSEDPASDDAISSAVSGDAEHKVRRGASGGTISFPDAQDALEVENLIESYQILGEWIRFADAKAAAVLTVNGVLAGLLIPPIHDYMQSSQTHPAGWWVPLVSSCLPLGC